MAIYVTYKGNLEEEEESEDEEEDPSIQIVKVYNTLNKTSKSVGIKLTMGQAELRRYLMKSMGIKGNPSAFQFIFRPKGSDEQVLISENFQGFQKVLAKK